MLKREAFGKTLIEQPVVRNKFGNMGRMVESLQAWTEQIIFELRICLMWRVRGYSGARRRC